MSEYIIPIIGTIVATIISNTLPKSKDNFIINNSFSYKLKSNLNDITKSLIIIILLIITNYFLAIYIVEEIDKIKDTNIVFAIEIFLIFIIFGILFKYMDKIKNKKIIVKLLYIVIAVYYSWIIESFNSIYESKEIYIVLYLVFVLYSSYIFISALFNTVKTYKEQHTIYTKSGEMISSNNIKRDGKLIIIEVEKEFYHSYERKPSGYTKDLLKEEILEEEKNKIKIKHFITVNEDDIKNIQSTTIEPLSKNNS
jgi:hypothetical protein